MQSLLPTVPAWWPWGAHDYAVVRFLLRRGLALVYLVAYLVAARQFRPLAGEDGLRPLEPAMERLDVTERPTVFKWAPSDRAVGATAWGGVALSAVALVGIPSRLGLAATVVVWGLLWLGYQSLVNAGGIFYGYGWETMLLESGFLAIFLGAAGHATPEPVIWLFRWLLLRNMLGAGLIKLRGDECWRELTCLEYHYETQPMPNAVSWYVHHAPRWFHKGGVVANHVVEVAVPVFYMAPQPVAAVAGVLTIAFQGWLVLTGNFSWLNWLTAVQAIATFHDGLFRAFPVDWSLVVPAASDPAPLPLWVAVALLVAVVVVLSYWPVRNLISSRQRMNTSFDPLSLVNSYGAFGSITKTRHEVVVEGTTDEPGPDAEWREYEFPGKPGDSAARPPQVAPYHHRLGWQLWFAALGSPRRSGRWLRPLMRKLAAGEESVDALVALDPFGDDSPDYVRASFYRYRFTTPAERRETGRWWHRERVETYLGPMSAEGPVSGGRGVGLGSRFR